MVHFHVEVHRPHRGRKVAGVFTLDTLELAFGSELTPVDWDVLRQMEVSEALVTYAGLHITRIIDTHYGREPQLASSSPQFLSLSYNVLIAAGDDIGIPLLMLLADLCDENNQ